MNIVNGALVVFAAFVMAMPLAGSIGEKQKQPFQKFLTISIICHTIVLLLDATQWFLLDKPIIFNKGYLLLLTVLPMVIALIGNGCFVLSIFKYVSERISILSKLVRPLILVFFMSVIMWGWFIFTDGETYVSALRNAEPSFHSNWLYWLSQVSWALMCVVGIVVIFIFRKSLKRAEIFSFLSYCILPLIALITEFFWNGPQVYLSTTLSLILVHSVLYREQKQRLRENEAQLTQSRIAVMINQIQPHFIFNTLSAICGLCDENPAQAKIVTEEFAEYLRHNVESLNQKTPVRFNTELRHVEVYLSIEKKRYESRLNVIYNITTEDFRLPALTVQPLIENAVKHGISKQERMGTVRLSTVEHDNCYIIEIVDDGVGFDTENLGLDTNKHIGIENVKNRLWAMCKGTLSINSEQGVGTTAIVKIPKNSGGELNDNV